MNKFKDIFLNSIRGFCMALADSVPGVSGGTIAFLLGFYDKFIESLHDLFYANLKSKIKAVKFLLKIALGWIIGFSISIMILTSVFESHIYEVCSLFLGFVIFAIPFVYLEDRASFDKKWKYLFYTFLGIAFVVAISLLGPSTSEIDISLSGLNFTTVAYVFVCAAVAISAMVLPGISGSSLLLIFGLYIPVMSALKEVFKLNFDYLPIIGIFILGIIVGAVLFIKILNKALTSAKSQTMFFVMGMMIGSLYSITQGPLTLENPIEPMTLSSFSILFFVLGGVVVLGLQLLKKKLS